MEVKKKKNNNKISRRHIPSSSSVPFGHSLQLKDKPLIICSSGVRSVQFVPPVHGLSWQPSRSNSQKSPGVMKHFFRK